MQDSHRDIKTLSVVELFKENEIAGMMELYELTSLDKEDMKELGISLLL